MKSLPLFFALLALAGCASQSAQKAESRGPASTGQPTFRYGNYDYTLVGQPIELENVSGVQIKNPGVMDEKGVIYALSNGAYGQFTQGLICKELGFDYSHAIFQGAKAKHRGIEFNGGQARIFSLKNRDYARVLYCTAEPYEPLR